jgi:hypothetical protein
MIHLCAHPKSIVSCVNENAGASPPHLGPAYNDTNRHRTTATHARKVS